MARLQRKAETGRRRYSPVASSSHAVAAPSPIALGHGLAVTRPALLRRFLPLWSMLIAAIFVVSRRPDAIMNAQFWAEDGKLFYADVYNRGLLATLAVPQAGYFQELPTLVVGIAQLVPLALAPLVTNSIAIVIRVLPVGLLLSRRAETIAPDIRVRALLAALYIALPGSPESNANIDNALWYLAVAAVIVLMLRPPVRRSTRVLDMAIVAMCSLTGVFSIALAPLAFLYRRWRGSGAVSRPMLTILSAGAVLQLLALFVLQYHLPSGFGAHPRVSTSSDASISGFFQVFGTRVVAEPLLGDVTALGAVPAACLGVLGAVCAAIAFRRGTAELKLWIAFGAALFVMAIAQPWNVNWPGLATFPSGARYFIIPQFATVATLVWAIGHMRQTHLRVGLTALFLYMCLVTIPQDWTYPPFERTGFTQEAMLFEHMRPGRHMTFPLEPMGWSMTLVKH